MNPVIDINELWFSYNSEPVLEDITLNVERGEFLGLIGPNAGGKSTLLKLLLGLLTPSRGSIEILGTTPVQARGRIGYVPQYAMFDRKFPISVEETVMLGRLGLTRTLGSFSRHDRQRAREALATVEIGHLRNRGLHELSGGQLQRVMIARALACDPEILLLDEPTANIDMRAEEDIFALLKSYNSRMTIIVVSHDIAFISTYVSLVACLNHKLICHQAGPLESSLIEELYGQPMHMVHHGDHGH